MPTIGVLLSEMATPSSLGDRFSAFSVKPPTLKTSLIVFAR